MISIPNVILLPVHPSRNLPVICPNKIDLWLFSLLVTRTKIWGHHSLLLCRTVTSNLLWLYYRILNVTCYLVPLHKLKLVTVKALLITYYFPSLPLIYHYLKGRNWPTFNKSLLWQHCKITVVYTPLSWKEVTYLKHTNQWWLWSLIGWHITIEHL